MAQSSLNQAQYEAASHFKGPALILAGPGTGKTTTLVGRYELLLQRGVDPGQIFATTFTNASAVQLKERIVRRTGLGVRQLMVGTFHSLCLRMLDGEVGEEIGLTGRVKLAHDADRFKIIRDVADRSLEAEDVLSTIDRCKDRLIDPVAARKELDDLDAAGRELRAKYVQAYEDYQRRLQKAQLHDFGDLLTLVVGALRTHAELRRRLSGRYQFLMVDEFQDVNPAQHALICLLLDQHDNLWAVGDDDQAIYGWRGSNIRYILDFAQTFNGAAVYRLAENYRSQPVIIERATRLVANNNSRYDKPLRPVAASSPRRPLRVCAAASGAAEAEWIANSVQALAHDGVRHQDIAVLVRVNHLMPTISSALKNLSIPFWIRGGRKIWSSTPAQILLGGVALWGKVTGTRWRVPTYLESAVQQLVDQHAGGTLGTVIDALAQLADQRMPFRDQPEREIEWEGMVERLQLEAKAFGGAVEFLEYAGLQVAEESKEGRGGGVCISTIHQAKGLEWGAVFLAGGELGLMPHAKNPDHEEERRLAYVAVTRAKNHLSVSWARTRGQNHAGASGFIEQLVAGADPSDVEQVEWPKPWSRGEPLSVRKGPAVGEDVAIGVGSEVFLTGYGVGKVVGMSGDRLELQLERGTLMRVSAGAVKRVDTQQRR